MAYRSTHTGAQIDAAITGMNSGVIGYATKALMDADLVPADAQLAVVTNDDVNPANNGYYRKSGATGVGSWVSGASVGRRPTGSAAGLAALQGISGSFSGEIVYLEYRTTAGDGGHGEFRWSASDLSTEVAADTQSGIYVAPDSDATGASGAWVRNADILTPSMFGAARDGITDDTTANDAFWTYVNSISSGPRVSGVYEFSPANIAGTLAGKFNVKPKNPYAVINADLHTCWIGYGGHESFPNIIGSENGTSANYSGVLGYDNTVDGLASAVWHFHGTIGKDATHAGIFGGSYGEITAGNYCAILGGTANTIVGGDYNVVAGGRSNTVGIDADGVSIVGGSSNSNSGQNSPISGGVSNVIGTSGDRSVIAGGGFNTATATGSVISGGTSNTVSAQYATVTGGLSNEATGSYSRSGGREASPQYGCDAWASGGFSSVKGSAQAFDFVTRKITTDGIETDQYLDGSAVKLTIPENTVWHIKTQCIADDGTDTAVFEFNSVIVRGAGSTTTSPTAVDSPTVVYASAGASTWTHRITVPTSGSINVKAQGEAGKTIRWVTRCQGVQLKR